MAVSVDERRFGGEHGALALLPVEAGEIGGSGGEREGQ